MYNGSLSLLKLKSDTLRLFPMKFVKARILHIEQGVRSYIVAEISRRNGWAPHCYDVDFYVRVNLILFNRRFSRLVLVNINYYRYYRGEGGEGGECERVQFVKCLSKEVFTEREDCDGTWRCTGWTETSHELLIFIVDDYRLIIIREYCHSFYYL